MDSPEIRALKAAKVPTNVDLSTAAGKKAFLDASAKVAAAEAFAPLIERSERVQKQAAYLSLREQYPELKDPAYEQRVIAKIKEQEASGAPVDTETAFLLVQAADERARTAQRRAAEDKARIAGTKVMGRSTAGVGARTLSGPPTDVVRNGKLGEWIRNNPEAAKAATGR
jgi:hypothetical protein